VLLCTYNGCWVTCHTVVTVKSAPTACYTKCDAAKITHLLPREHSATKMKVRVILNALSNYRHVAVHLILVQ